MRMFSSRFGGTFAAQARVTSSDPARALRIHKTPLGVLLFGSLVALSLAPSVAYAQVQPGCTSTLPATYNPFTQVIGGVAGAVNSISSVIGTVNTAFQAQGDAFAVGLPNAQTDQIAGGVWGRAIGGRVDNQATGTFSGSISPGMGGTPPFASGFLGGPGATGTINCQSDIRQDYAGFQLGQDLARLNLSGSGATLHAGVTGGYAESSAQDLAGSAFNGGFQVPFAGVYAVYANGNFFADALLRGDFYQMNLNAAPAALGNQKLDGVGLTEIISAGYKIDLSNSWFIQPSFSGIHSSTKIDTLNLPGGFGNFFNPLYLPPASVQFGTVESWLGRIGAQVGTSFTAGNVLLQPFATASVWHEFAGNVTANYAAPEFYASAAQAHSLFPCSLANASLYPNGCGNAVAGTVSGSRVGTYGQYSLGVFGQMTGSPWLGYVRLDLKEGANVEALGFNGGLRYQFDGAEHFAEAGHARASAQASAYDWTGLYVGGFTGAAWGKTNWNFPQAATSADPQIAGVIGGGTLGYNKQFDRWVVGVESDVAFTNATGGQSCLPSVNDANIGQNCNDSIHVLATAAARVGYTWLDRVLLFAKLGGAWTNNALAISCNGDVNFFQGSCFPNNNPFAPVGVNLAMSDPRFGATIGAGFELALTPAWSAKLEYDFLDFGSKSFVLSDTTPVTVREYFNELKFGLNYHFNAYDPDPAAPAAVAVKALVKAPPPAPYSWTGAYAGVEAAYRMADAGWNTTALPVTALISPPFITVPDPTTNPADFFSAAAQGGAFVGYDWQVARHWVTGVEGDLSFGNSSMSRGGIPGTFGNGSAPAFFALPGIEALQADSSAVKFGWDGSIRARIGYLFTPSVLMYGTGGVAFQQLSVTANCSGFVTSWCDSARRFFTGLPVIEPPKSETASTVKTGLTVGGGVESVLTGNWLGKAEFRYANFGRFNHAFFAGTIDEVDMNVHPQTYTFLAGVGYKFHGTGNLLTQ
jgi:opacity protein-like surface antigen